MIIRIEYRCWKIVEVDKRTIKTLFHAHKGSRKLPRKTWLKAESKMVDDGEGEYKSGWHVFKDRNIANNYLSKRFKRKGLKVVECLACSLRRKSHSRDEIYLAGEIYLE